MSTLIKRLERATSGEFSEDYSAQDYVALCDEALTELKAVSERANASGRQVGHTTRQMRHAPACAVYVWCNSNVHYPASLARSLERSDLEIRPLSWLTPDNVVRSGIAAVVIDHAAQFNDENRAAMEVLLRRNLIHTPWSAA